MRAILMAVSILGASVHAQDRSEIEREATAAAVEAGLDPQLVLAVIEVESQFNPHAIGRSHGEIGLMQLHPRYFPMATFDIATNIKLGVEHLAQIKRVKRGEGCAWFVYYNVGVNRQLRHPAAHPYFKKVTEAYPSYCENLSLASN